MLDWINNRYAIQLNEEDLVSLKNFSLIWNIFEGTVCDNSFSIATVEQSIAGRNFTVAEFEGDLLYFQNRYIEHGAPNNRYPYLYFRPNDREPFVRDVLLGIRNNIEEIVLAIIIIIYQYRNNLFHGLKEIREIDQQEPNFNRANSFLQTFLNHYF